MKRKVIKQIIKQCMKINNNLLTKQLCNLLYKLFSKTIVYVVIFLDPLPLFSSQTYFYNKYAYKYCSCLPKTSVVQNMFGQAIWELKSAFLHPNRRFVTTTFHSFFFFNKCSFPKHHFLTQSKYVFKNKYGRLAHSLQGLL